MVDGGFHAIHADPLGAVCITAPAKPTLPSSSIGYPPAVLLQAILADHTDVALRTTPAVLVASKAAAGQRSAWGACRRCS